jgi:DNA-binding transcriptional regulator YiaG
MRKYGLEAFQFEILETCIPEELNHKEQQWIAKLRSNNKRYGYNLTSGGDTTKPLVLTANDAKQIRNILQETKLTQEQIARQFNVTQRTVSYINSGDMWFDANTQYPIRKRSEPPKLCAVCEQPIRRTSTLCSRCEAKRRRAIKAAQRAQPTDTNYSHPLSRNDLKTLVRTHMISDVARQFHVSPTTIRRWCKQLNLPHSKRYIDSLNDSEWTKL